ncbi:transglycosylase SLT domain-containing protein [Methylobacillus sp. Pita2]|uniref:lytic transglycosylase domain-containing protein n=1 Tax=Methylobacillus sp. Pita2 TaxID=3383245 RepID=UPI0038B5E15E
MEEGDNMIQGLLNPQKHNALLEEARKIEMFHHVPETTSKDGLVLAGTIIAGLVLAAQTVLIDAPANKPGNDAQSSHYPVHLQQDQYPEKLYIRDDQVDISPEAKRELAKAIDATWNTGFIRANQVVTMAVDAGSASDLDPILILSVMAKESSFNPAAVNKLGPEGLMQVWRKWHAEKYKELGIPAYQNPTPRENVILGAAVLKEYLHMEQFDIKRALQRYNGALALPGTEYADSVLEYHGIFSDAAGLVSPYRKTEAFRVSSNF